VSDYLNCQRSCDEGGAGYARLGVEFDEEFAGEGDADDHLFFSLSQQPVAEGSEVIVIFSSDVGDEKEDGSHACPSRADRAPAVALAAVIGEGGEACELGDRLVRDGTEFGQIGEQDGDGSIGEAFDRPDGLVEGGPDRIDLDQRGDLGGEFLGLTV